MSGSLFIYNTVSCPSCNSSISFRSKESNICVCTSCNNAIERNELGNATVSILPVSAAIPPGFLRLGARGKYQGKKFEITGCLHCDMNRYIQHRWTMSFDDGSSLLLTETLGFYAIQRIMKVDYYSKLQLIDAAEIGVDSYELTDYQKYYVFDKAKCEQSSIEGEIRLPDNDGKFVSIELGCPSYNKRIEVVEYKKGHFEVYSIEYVELKELSLEKDSTARPTPLTATCGSCGKPVTIQLPSYNNHCVCSSCYRWNQVTSNLSLSARDKNFSLLKGDIPLGAKGMLNNIPMEVIGICQKNEAGAPDTTWMEYTLYNEASGLYFLSEYNGHFTLLRETKRAIAYPVYQRQINVDGENYALFNEYSFDYKSANGEFILPLSNRNVQVKEFISPPEMYAVEVYDNREITWYHGQYISPDEVHKGFNLDAPLPAAYGTGPLQMMKGYVSEPLLWRMCVAALGIFLMAQIVSSAGSKNNTVFEETFLLQDSSGSKGIVSKPFTISGNSSNLQLYISAPVNNDWFEADITLVHEQTGKEFSLEKGIEYYYGFSEGESWSEGNRETEALLSSLPGGSYHMNIFPAAGSNSVNSFSIRAVNDVPMWRNFFIVAVIALLFPLIQWLRIRWFEQRRWNNSPYNSNQEEKE